MLDGCATALEPGRIYALLGANGAGKTTLFNLITGFLPLQTGEIRYQGRRLNGLKPYQINRLGVSRTFQDLRTITKLTVRENVLLAMPRNPTDSWHKALLPASLHKNGLAQLETEAGAIVGRYFLEAVSEHPAGEISYGQQKLLTIACCVANGAGLLLLDEPVAGINPEYRSKMVQLLQQLKAQGKTILLIEHNTDFINEVADRIYFLAGGKLSEYANLDEMRADPQVLEAYL